MDIIVTVKSFDGGMAQFNSLIPAISSSVIGMVNMLAAIDKPEPAIDISNLCAIHVPDDYRRELFAYQESIGHQTFSTENKIATGAAQVVDAHDGSHIFIDKQIILVILATQAFQNNLSDIEHQDLLNQVISQKQEYLQMVRHELAHVEEGLHQKGMVWLGELRSERSIKAGVLKEAHRLWQEFYVCKRSIISYELNVDSFKQLIRDINTAEKTMCDLRWKYNTQEISLDNFINLFHEYLYSGFVYCAYFCGHVDWCYDQFREIPFADMPSRILKFMPALWDAFRNMNRSYPHWESKEVLYELGSVYQDCMEEFKVFARDTKDGIWYDIPVEELIPYAER